MKVNSGRKRVYLAGPDVFFANAAEHFAGLKRLCQARGLEGLEPSDGGLSKGIKGTGDEIAERIYRANIELIQESDAVLANLMPFRGKMEPDSGTVFEVGFAIALGKPVAGYLPDIGQYYEDKVRQYFGHHEVGGLPFDAEHGFLIETLQQPMNLMLSRSSALFGDAAAALDHLAAKLA